MQLTTNSNTENNTGMQSEQLKVNASAAMFKLVYSSLYERKEEAVLRELAANGLDAHIDAGIPDTPISIKLPTELNPFLVVQDFGNGMSLDIIYKIYFTLFESTKNQDNGQVGGFGIGSKSPYSISESFTVSTVHDHKRTEIIMSMDNGTPHPILAAKEVSTDAPNGTTVTVPVSSDNSRRELVNVAAKLFTYWDVQPTIIGTNLQQIQKTPYLDTDHYSIDLSRWRNNHAVEVFRNVLIGPFAYSIPGNLHRRIKEAVDKSHSATARLFNSEISSNFDILLNTSIGELELAPSRERIEDTDDNFNVLYSYIVDVLEVSVATFYEKAVETVNYLHDVVPDTINELGLSWTKQSEIVSELTKMVGSTSLIEKLLSKELVNSLPDKYPSLKTKVSKLTTKLDKIDKSSYSNTNSYISVLELNNKGVGYYKKLRSLNTKELIPTSTSYRRKTYSINLNFSTRYILLEGDSLTNTEKARINYTLHSGNDIIYTLNSVDHIINSTNYVELQSNTDIQTVEDIVNNYIEPNKIIIISYADIESSLLTPPKSTRTKKVTRNNNKVIADYTKFYNTTIEESITVTNLYESDVFDSLDIAVIPDYNWIYTKTIEATCATKPTLVIGISSKELSTKRFQEFEQKSNVTTLMCTGRDIHDYFIDSKDYNNILKILAVEDLTNIYSLNYLPEKYKKLVEKHKLTSNNSLTGNIELYYMKDYELDTTNFFTEGSKEELVYRCMLKESNWNIKQTVDLWGKFHSTTIKRVVKSILNSITITK